MTAKHHLLGALWFSSALLLAACGSGGDDSSAPAGPQPAPAAPEVTLNYSIKQLQFSWPAVSGATYYRLLERSDATSALGQVGADLSGTTVNHEIALHQRVNASYRVEACNSSGCTASSDISLAANLLPAIGYFKASNTTAEGRFGASVALSGDGTTLAVGARNEDSSATGVNGDQLDTSAPDSGAVYVFVRTSAGAWTQQAYVKASNTGVGDGFGTRVALNTDGSTLAVAASEEDSAATGVGGNQSDNSALNAGAVYVFTRTAGVWSQEAYVKASNSVSNHRFGLAMALSADGSTLAVGARNAGAVYVFERTGAAWSQQEYMHTAPADAFGNAVALSGDGSTLAIGAVNEDSNAVGINGAQSNNLAPGAGAVYVLVRSGAMWSLQAYIKASNTDAQDEFGAGVALSADGTTLAVGAPGEASSATGIGGNQADNAAPSAGAIYVFVRAGATWSQQAYLKASNAEGLDILGEALALSADGSTLAAGAVSENGAATGINGNQADNLASGAGSAYVFVRNGATWTQQAYVKASNSEAQDTFGSSGAVALSADGRTLAIGALREDSFATGIGSNQSDNSLANSGAVYLY